MKLTTKLILAIVAVLTGAVVALAVWTRVEVGGILAGDSGPSVELTGRRVEREYDLEGFDTLAVKGGWQIRIEEGARYAVRVSTDEALAERITVTREGDTLTLGADRFSLDPEAALRAELTMPGLNEVSIDGGADVEIAGFATDRLAVGVAGAARIRSRGGRFGRLELDLEGASAVDFTESEVVSADVRMDGAGEVELSMRGGALTGRIGGVGSVVYGGEVSEESVRVDGLGSVERR